MRPYTLNQLRKQKAFVERQIDRCEYGPQKGSKFHNKQLKELEKINNKIEKLIREIKK